MAFCSLLFVGRGSLFVDGQKCAKAPKSPKVNYSWKFVDWGHDKSLLGYDTISLICIIQYYKLGVK